MPGFKAYSDTALACLIAALGGTMGTMGGKGFATPSWFFWT